MTRRTGLSVEEALLGHAEHKEIHEWLKKRDDYDPEDFARNIEFVRWLREENSRAAEVRRKRLEEEWAIIRPKRQAELLAKRKRREAELQQHAADPVKKMLYEARTKPLRSRL